MGKKSNKNRLRKPTFVLTVRDSSGNLLKVEHGISYDFLWLRAVKLAKELRGNWTIHNSRGQYIDGDFINKNNKELLKHAK